MYSELKLHDRTIFQTNFKYQKNIVINGSSSAFKTKFLW